MNNGYKSPAAIVTAAVVLIGALLVAFVATPAIAGIALAPVVFGPLLISLILSAKSPCSSCQWTLIVGSVAYAAWFGFVYVEAFFIHVDAQSGVMLFFIPIYSMPVMIPVWLLTIVLRRRSRSPD